MISLESMCPFLHHLKHQCPHKMEQRRKILERILDIDFWFYPFFVFWPCFQLRNFQTANFEKEARTKYPSRYWLIISTVWSKKVIERILETRNIGLQHMFKCKESETLNLTIPTPWSLSFSRFLRIWKSWTPDGYFGLNSVWDLKNMIIMRLYFQILEISISFNFLPDFLSKFRILVIFGRRSGTKSKKNQILQIWHYNIFFFFPFFLFSLLFLPGE